MSRQMLFGPVGHMKYIKMPQPGGSFSPVGYNESMQYLSGRMGLRRSLGSHREFDFAWKGERSELRHIIDCAGGMYGHGPFYFLEPTWMDQNVLPAHWAAPSLGVADAPPIYGEKRPSLAAMTANDGTWPADGALFRHQPTADLVDVYVPIPPGHTLHFWYAGTANAVLVTRYLGKTAGTTLTPSASNPLLPLASQAATSISNGAGIDGVRIRLALSSSLATATIYGMRAVVLPSERETTSLTETGFVGGQGHAGCDFDGHPVITPYSIPYDSIGVTARLVEVDL